MIVGYNPETHFERFGDQTQYFLDDTVLEWVKNIKRTHHVAAKHAANPVIRRDRPWEVWPHFNTTVTALRDEDSRFRCWYMDFTNLALKAARRPFGSQSSAMPSPATACAGTSRSWAQ